MSKITIENEFGYDCWSETYDHYPNPTVKIDQRVFPQKYRDLKNSKVLEIGCGTGRHTAQLVAQENFVTGIDISEGMLEKARTKLKGEKVALFKVDFMKTDDLFFAPYEAAVMSLVLEHIQNLDEFFSKLRRYMNRNGIFYLSEIHPERASSGILAHFKNGKGEEHHLSSSAHSQVEIQNAAKKNKFEILSIETIEGDSQLASENPKWEKYLGQPMIQIWKMQAV